MNRSYTTESTLTNSHHNSSSSCTTDAYAPGRWTEKMTAIPSYNDIEEYQPWWRRIVFSANSIFRLCSLPVSEISRIVKHRYSIKGNQELSYLRVKIFALFYSMEAEWLSGIVTFLNFLLILQETDLDARKDPIPPAVMVPGLLCLLYFTIEMMMRLFVERKRALKDGWNLLDIAVVLSGAVSLGYDLFNDGGKSSIMTNLKSLRCLRLMRLLKSLSVIKGAGHLRSVVRSVGACLKLLLFTFPIIFIVMTMWAALAVQMVHPIMDKVAKRTAAWDGCGRCSRSFQTVMDANLTLFQTIIAGDSWGLVAIPVIEYSPLTSLIFVGSLLTIATGVLNLVVAILVDAAQEARAGDVEMRAIEAKQQEISEKRTLKKMFIQMDADESGALSFDELLEGASSITELEQMLRTMDIHADDLEQLFAMLDEDGSGEVDPEEFIDTLYRLKCGDNKTAATFVKRYVLHMKKSQNDIKHNVVAIEEMLHSLKESFGAMGFMKAAGGLSHRSHRCNDNVHFDPSVKDDRNGVSNGVSRDGHGSEKYHQRKAADELSKCNDDSIANLSTILDSAEDDRKEVSKGSPNHRDDSPREAFDESSMGNFSKEEVAKLLGRASSHRDSDLHVAALCLPDANEHVELPSIPASIAFNSRACPKSLNPGESYKSAAASSFQHILRQEFQQAICTSRDFSEIHEMRARSLDDDTRDSLRQEVGPNASICGARLSHMNYSSASKLVATGQDSTKRQEFQQAICTSRDFPEQPSNRTSKDIPELREAPASSGDNASERLLHEEVLPQADHVGLSQLSSSSCRMATDDQDATNRTPQASARWQRRIDKVEADGQVSTDRRKSK